MDRSKTKGKDQSVVRKDLTWEAYQDIRRMIFSNELKPGQKIPYREMAKGLNMSLTPVVQALKHMEFMGLVCHEQNRGFFIEKVTPNEIEEAYKLRLMLEPKLLIFTIEYMDKEGEKRLEKAYNEYLEVSNSPSLKIRLVKDIQFHMVLAKLSKQTISIQILRYLFDFLYLRFSQELLFSRPHENAAKDHTAVFEAVMAGDVEKATKALKDHINNIYGNAVHDIQNRLSEPEAIIF